MTRLRIVAATAVLIAAGPVQAVPGGDLAVLPTGEFICELPGDAGDLGIAAGRHQPALDFEVVGNSNYRVDGVRGAYLRIGDRVTMTSGPGQGRRFRAQTDVFLRALNPDGSDGDLRCVHSDQAAELSRGDERRAARCRTGTPTNNPANTPASPLALGGAPRPSC